MNPAEENNKVVLINQPKQIIPRIADNNTALKEVIEAISPTNNFTSAPNR